MIDPEKPQNHLLVSYFETRPLLFGALFFLSGLGALELFADVLRLFGIGRGDKIFWIFQYMLASISAVSATLALKSQSRINKGEAKRCSKCRSAISLVADKCPYCGKDFSEEDAST